MRGGWLGIVGIWLACWSTVTGAEPFERFAPWRRDASSGLLVQPVAATSGSLREQLRVELGRGFDVVTTQRHFVVAFPQGQRDLWSPRFEEIYNNFYLYFSVRGIKLHEPAEPLVVIVFPTQQDFLRYSASDGTSVPSGVLGYYLPRTNRVAMYDQRQAGDESWSRNAETLIHELAHQIAFNTGVHNRQAPTPRWLAEGLGTLFEARGVWKSRTYNQPADRLNVDRFQAFRQFADEKVNLVEQLVADDRLFSTDPARAYACAWALTFYLTETQPRKYSEYLQRTATRTFQQRYGNVERIADFTQIFGSNLTLFNVQFQRYLKSVKGP